MRKELDIIIPISLCIDSPTPHTIIRDIVEQHERYGFTRFVLAGPGGGFRHLGYAPRSWFTERAEWFCQIRQAVAPRGISLGFWITTTVKSGHREDFAPIIKANGEPHPFANCPLCEAFTTQLATDIAEFARIAKPDFIITEDDFSLSAANGCFCNAHLDAFAARCGRRYTREELLAVLNERTPQAIDIIRKWRELSRDTQVDLATAIRKAVDRHSPEIPIGYMQAYFADNDGDATEAIARALAGPRHVPFSRLEGADYGGIHARNIPDMLYHILYSRQHLPRPFSYYLEGDTFPHTRFFSAGRHMMAVMAIAFSYGFDGATFQTQQLLDEPNEESAYGLAFAAERARFNEANHKAKQCTVKGVELSYDPFWNTLSTDKSSRQPLWTNVVGRFGIPYTSTADTVTFWDERNAKYADDATIRKALSGALFLDGEAAKCLYDRGYGEYLGVSVGGDILDDNPNLRWDIGTREIICAPFVSGRQGKHMTAAWMLAPRGNGILYPLTVTDAKCEPITEYYDSAHRFIATSMTRFQNTLGGKVIVMGLSVNHNGSQALYNYRRKRLLQEQIAWCCDDYVMVKDAPDVLLVENVANDREASGFTEMLTLVNACEDPLSTITLRLPERLKGRTVQYLDPNGTWQPLTAEPTSDGITLPYRLEYCTPCYLLIT